MFTTPTQTEVVQYGSTEGYIELPTEAEQKHGVEPLDTCPAQWWNALWAQASKQLNASLLDMINVRDELSAVITEGLGHGPAGANNELKAAIMAIHRRVADSSTVGGVKAGTGIKQVNVDSTGLMTVNALSDWEGSSTVQQKIKAVDDKIAALDVADPTVDGTTASDFIATIKQEDGKITATKKSLPSASTSAKGIVKAGAGIKQVNVDNSGVMTVNALSDWTGTDTVQAKMTTMGSRVTAVETAIGALDATDPTASGTTTAFIDSITQIDGQIAATKKNLPSASATVSGISKLGEIGTTTPSGNLVLWLVP